MFSDPGQGISAEFAERGFDWAISGKYYLVVVGAFVVFLIAVIGFVKIVRLLEKQLRKARMSKGIDAEKSREYRMPSRGWPTPQSS